ncbi:MAG: tetratricopeptide repeat protein [Woeseiaceae bacterium]|nr:tetratricopeptide repeat protein [Woeseiaceae bacterium]
MTQTCFRLNDWYVDVRLGRVSRGSQTVHLEPQVMKVLAYLASRPGDVIDKDELFRALWNGGVVSDAALARCISQIRKTFGDDRKQPRIVETLPKRGYRLIADVQSASAEATVRGRWRWLTAAAAAGLVIAVIVATQFARPGIDAALAGYSDEAVQAYEIGRELHARYTYPFNQNAIVHFEKALAREPDFALAHAGLADALVQEAHYWNGKRAAEALRHAERAVELEPAHIETVRALGKALAINGHDDRAVEAYEQALGIDPDDALSALQLANLHFVRLDFDNAETFYLQALRAAPELDVAMSNLGYLYLKAGDTDAARHWLERALELYPLQQDAASRLAMLEMFTGQPELAQARCERLLASYPDNYACLQLRAVTRLSQGEFDAALQGFSQVLDAYPDDRYARLGQARALLAQQRTNEANALVEAVLVESNDNIANGAAEAYDYWLIAGSHAVLGNDVAAYEWFDKAAAAGRRFSLWDASDPLFANLRGDRRFDHYIAATRSLSSSGRQSSVN